MTDALNTYFGFPHSALGMLGSPLNAMAQPSEQQLVALQAAYLAPDYLGQMQSNAGALQRLERETFYRSCSQHWLDAMIDVELGLTRS